jgi:hypothetical protein
MIKIPALSILQNGMQQVSKTKWLPMYTDLLTKSTFLVQLHKGETVDKAVGRVRERFNIK